MQLFLEFPREPKPMNHLNDWLSIAGNVSSILGLLVTLVVFVKLRHIHRSFLFQARLPDLRKKIAGHRSTISRLLSTFADSAHEIETEIHRCHANLQSLRRKLGRVHAGSVRNLLKQTREATKGPGSPSRDKVRQIYLSLVLLEEELENLSRDIKWRPGE